MNRKPVPRRVGIVGAGPAARPHLEGIKRHPEGTCVAALCDADPAALAERAAENGIKETYPEVSAMIAQAHLDLAIVCTPAAEHAAAVLPLLAAGIPVLCEKPLAPSFAEARALAAEAQRRGVALAVNQNWRRFFSFHLARAVLAAGSIGRPRSLLHTRHQGRPEPEGPLTPATFLAGNAIHWFDGYRWLLGEEPDTVYAQSLAPSPGTLTIAVTLHFPGGVLVCLTESIGGHTTANTCILDGDRASLMLDTQWLRLYRAPTRYEETPNPFPMCEAAHYLLDDLAAAVAAGREPETSAADHLHTLRILEAATRSLAEQRPVRLAEIG